MLSAVSMTYSISKACVNKAVALMSSGAAPLLCSALRLLAGATSSIEEDAALSVCHRGSADNGILTRLNAHIAAVHPGHVRSKMGGYTAALSPGDGAAAVARALLSSMASPASELVDDGRQDGGGLRAQWWGGVEAVTPFYQPDGRPFATGWE